MAAGKIIFLYESDSFSSAIKLLLKSLGCIFFSNREYVFLEAGVPQPFCTRDWFCGRQCFHGPVVGWGVAGGVKFPDDCIIVHFISVIILSALPQIIRH